MAYVQRDFSSKFLTPSATIMFKQSTKKPELSLPKEFLKKKLLSTDASVWSTMQLPDPRSMLWDNSTWGTAMCSTEHSWSGKKLAFTTGTLWIDSKCRCLTGLNEEWLAPSWGGKSTETRRYTQNWFSSLKNTSMRTRTWPMRSQRRERSNKPS